MAQSSVRPFFYKSFGAEPEPLAAPLPAPVPPPPSYGEADLSAARAAAREEGFKEGLERGLSQLDRDQAARSSATSAAATALAAQFDALIERQQRFFDMQGPLLTQIALAAARRVAGHSLRTEPTAEIEAMVSRCLRELADEQALHVAVHPQILHLIEAAYAEKAKSRPKDTQRLRFSADDRLEQLDDCRIEWPSGMLERNQADSWTRIEIALAAFDPAALPPEYEIPPEYETLNSEPTQDPQE